MPFLLCWRESFGITKNEAATLKDFLLVAYERQWIFVEVSVARSMLNAQHFVFVASDESKHLVSWVGIPAEKPLSIKY